MSINQVRDNEVRVKNFDLKLEAVVIAVSDVDRAKQFYGNLGWRLDADFRFDNGFRVVQFTPPGSACSVQFGSNITLAAPGSAQGLYLIVSRLRAASYPPAVSRSARCSTPGRRALSSRAMARPVASAGQRPITPATAPLPRSATRTAMVGCCKRSRHGYPAGSTPLRLHSLPRRTWRARFGVPRPPTASTRSAPGNATRTGPTGTQRTWWRSTQERSCRRERLLNQHGQTR